jgi:hypothetical protein
MLEGFCSARKCLHFGEVERVAELWLCRSEYTALTLKERRFIMIRNDSLALVAHQSTSLLLLPYTYNCSKRFLSSARYKLIGPVTYHKPINFAEFVMTATALHESTTATSEAVNNDRPPSLPTPRQSWACNTCCITFNDGQAQREHMKSAWQ